MKAVSPLIASILLIAITVTVASLMSGWTSATFSSVQKGMMNKTSSALSCSSAAISIDKVFIGAGNNGTASVVVRNNGNVDNLIVTSGQLYDRLGNNFSANNTLTLNVGQLGTLTFKMPTLPNTVMDSSVFSNIATCKNMTGGVCNFGLSGQSGGDMNFVNSSGSFVNVTYNSWLNFTDNFTVSFWVKPTSSTVGTLVQKGVYTDGTANSFGIFGSGTSVSLIVRRYDTSSLVMTSTANLSVNSYNYVTATQNGTGTARTWRIYLNGVLDSTANQGVWNMLSTSESLTIGSSERGLNSFQGYIDEVRLWNRTLSGTEINTTMNGGIPSNNNDLVLWLRSNEGTGILSCPADFSSARVTTQCADASDVYTARPNCPA